MWNCQCEAVIQNKWFVMEPKATPPLPTPMYHRIFNSSYPHDVLFLFTSFYKMNVTRFGYMAKAKS
jgi:hypothetical protein